MIEVTEFQPITYWRQNGLRPQPLEDGSYSKPRLPDDDSLLDRAKRLSLPRNSPGILPIPAVIVQPQQISPGLLSDVDRFVYGLLDAPANNGPTIEVEMPLHDWFWCGDPATPPRVCLKKRMSILSHFAS